MKQLQWDWQLTFRGLTNFYVWEKEEIFLEDNGQNFQYLDQLLREQKIGKNDGNHDVQCFDRYKQEYDFFEEGKEKINPKLIEYDDAPTDFQVLS